MPAKSRWGRIFTNVENIFLKKFPCIFYIYLVNKHSTTLCTLYYLRPHSGINYLLCEFKWVCYQSRWRGAWTMTSLRGGGTNIHGDFGIKGGSEYPSALNERWNNFEKSFILFGDLIYKTFQKFLLQKVASHKVLYRFLHWSG